MEMWAHLASGCVLGDEANKGEHGEAAVLQLLQLVLLKDLPGHPQQVSANSR